jgi:hypothetical protein
MSGWRRFEDNSAAWLDFGEDTGTLWELSIWPVASDEDKKSVERYAWRGPFRVSVTYVYDGDLLKEYTEPTSKTYATASEARDAAWALLRRVVERGDG